MSRGDLLLALVVSLPALVLIVFTVVDVVRRSDLPVFRRIGWLALVVIVPVIGTVIYLLARPFPEPVNALELGNDRTTELIELIRQREAGALGTDGFRAALNRLTGGRGLG